MTSVEFDALLERRRALERSVRRARDVLATRPNLRLEQACAQAAEVLLEVRAAIEAELAAVRGRVRRLRSTG